MKEKIIISLGGSLIVPDKIDINFLKDFKKIILKHIKTKQFYIITGGGSTARKYANAAEQTGHISMDDRDWLGIHCTRLNGHLLKTIFKEHAYSKVVKNPNKKIQTNKPVVIAAGYKPGCSSDLDAVQIAKSTGAKTVLNLSNINYVYDKDPKKHKNAQKIKKTTWTEFRKIIPKKWRYGMHTPFDPVASEAAQKLKLNVIIMNGKKLKQVSNFLHKKPFAGTLIEHDK